MSDISLRIAQLTTELNELLRELSAANDETMMRKFVEEVTSSDLIANFKGSIDVMRHLVWLYIEAAANRKGHPAWQDAKSLDRATSMLRSLHGDSTPQHLSSGVSFLESVEAVVREHGSSESDT